MVVTAVDDQGRHIDLLQIVGLVGFRLGPDPEVASRKSGQHTLVDKLRLHALGYLRAGAVVAIERQRQILPEL